ncbi:MAG: hypothetical protein ACPG7F_21520 [Aggregatilineales bacterium]
MLKAHIMSERRRPRNRQSTPQRVNTSSLPPDHSGVLIAAVIIGLMGWVGLYQLITQALPRIGGELWLFFILLQMAITGSVIPIVRYLNVRFTPLNKEVPPGGVIVRQSVWVGLFVVTCAWLLIPRVLTVPLMLFLIFIFVVLELFLRSRERAAEST